VKKRLWSFVIVGCLVLVASSLGLVSTYPSKPVEIIVPWSAGGATDVLFRALAAVFPKYANNQQLIVKNVPGGGSVMGFMEAMYAPPDGYTILGTASPMVSKTNMEKVDFTVTSYEPVILVVDNPCYLLVPADSKYKDLRDFVADAKKRPGQINVANGGAGGGTHFATLAFQSFVEIKLNHIPFAGGGPQVTALLGKQVDASMNSAPEGLPQVQAGQLRMLGVFGDERLKGFPNVPTAKEQGINFTFTMWRGVMAPKNTPAAIVKQLHDIFKKCMEDPEFKKKADELSLELRYMDGPTFGKFILAEDERYRKICIEEKLGTKYGK